MRVVPLPGEAGKGFHSPRRFAVRRAGPLGPPWAAALPAAGTHLHRLPAQAIGAAAARAQQGAGARGTRKPATPSPSQR